MCLMHYGIYTYIWTLTFITTVDQWLYYQTVVLNWYEFNFLSGQNAVRGPLGISWIADWWGAHVETQALEGGKVICMSSQSSGPLHLG